jgi:hypothetical protein
MAFTLTTVFDDTLEFNGKVYKVDMSFDNILRLFEMFDDDLILSVEKPFVAIQMLLNGFEWKFDNIDQALELFNFLLKEFLDIGTDNEGEDEQKVFDFIKDAEAIYASFMAAYNIDLFEVKGKLHWKKFIALLNNLDDESAFKQIISIRTMKIPKADEASQEYRDHIIKMKRVYALDNKANEEQIGRTLDDFALILKGAAN